MCYGHALRAEVRIKLPSKLIRCDCDSGNNGADRTVRSSRWRMIAVKVSRHDGLYGLTVDHSSRHFKQKLFRLVSHSSRQMVHVPDSVDVVWFVLEVLLLENRRRRSRPRKKLSQHSMTSPSRKFLSEAMGR